MFSIISIILLFIGYHALKFKYNVLDFENNFSKKINIPVSIKNDELTFKK